MIRCSMGAFLLVILLGGAGGCQSIGSKTANETIHDASISAAIQSRLTGDRLSNFTRVEVETERGVANLSGSVSSAEERTRAEELARQVEGVVRVNNNIQVQHQPTKTGKLSQ